MCNVKDLRFEDLYSPEYYFEKEHYDCRIAIKKFHDARDTMGMAQLSLSYITQEDQDNFEKNFVRSIHLRHAIEDLNNSFDLLLQIPWIFYRAWESFNLSGRLRSRTLKNRDDIVRNTDNWVYTAEQACSYNKLITYLEVNQNTLKDKYEIFWNTYISLDQSHKPFTVRSLCNTLKHNHALLFKELYEPYDFNININGTVRNLRQQNLGIEFHQEFYDEANQNNVLGRVNYKYDSDLSVDIEFYTGEKFRYKDSSGDTNAFNLYEVFDECCRFHDALVDLFEDIYAVIYPMMQLLPSFTGQDGRPNIKPSNHNIDLNKYFEEI